MKSIKKKAEEHAPYTKEDSWNWIKTAINAQTSFEAGANYVLDAIEKTLDTALDEMSIKKGYLAAREVIEQLKSNQ